MRPSSTNSSSTLPITSSRKASRSASFHCATILRNRSRISFSSASGFSRISFSENLMRHRRLRQLRHFVYSRVGVMVAPSVSRQHTKAAPACRRRSAKRFRGGRGVGLPAASRAGGSRVHRAGDGGSFMSLDRRRLHDVASNSITLAAYAARLPLVPQVCRFSIGAHVGPANDGKSLSGNFRALS